MNQDQIDLYPADALGDITAGQPVTAAFDRVILGVDPGTNIMGYGVLGISGKRPVPVAFGVFRLDKYDDHYMRLHRIFDRVVSLVAQYLPDEMAIEAPFFGKNVQSMLKLGRAQGVAMAAALTRQVPITEYEPGKIKLAVTGNGQAAKEQVREMLRQILKIPRDRLDVPLDATDAMGAALCHFYETSRPGGGVRTPKSWKEFVSRNPNRVKGL